MYDLIFLSFFALPISIIFILTGVLIYKKEKASKVLLFFVASFTMQTLFFLGIQNYKEYKAEERRIDAEKAIEEKIKSGTQIDINEFERLMREKNSK